MAIGPLRWRPETPHQPSHRRRRLPSPKRVKTHVQQRQRKAGDGNRTHTTSLEGWSSTIELRPQESWSPYQTTSPAKSSFNPRQKNKTPSHKRCLMVRQRRQAKWGKQDSNLRRHCHQIYSLAPLAAWVFPHRSRDHIDASSLFASLIRWRWGPARRSWITPLTSRELAVGLEPTTPGLQNRSSAD